MFRAGRGYERIEEDNDRYTPEEQLLSQYEMPGRPFPKKEIIWGAAMLVLGLILVGLGITVHFEHWENRVPGVFCFSGSSSSSLSRGWDCVVLLGKCVPQVYTDCTGTG